MVKHDASDPVAVTRIITRPDHTSALQVQRAILKVIKGPDKGKQKDLGLLGLVVGSAEDCELVLSDPAVSRRHLTITPEEQGFRIQDLNSKNGTLIGSLRIDRVTLTGGEEIKIGQSRLRLVVLDEHEEYPLSPKTAFGALQGRSVAMRQVFAVLERAAESDTILLLEGESGTGKDLAAEMVHQFSPRRDKPFNVVDCATMQSTLVESELFGHCKGAFTGADRDRTGAFESANGGTVFMDEIGEIDIGLQPKLLRLLEKREVKRLGENRYRPVNVRLIAATNRDLNAEVEAGRFREDLYYRLSVLKVRLPPLRDRREDIGPLARSFVQKLNAELDPVEVISDEVMAMFLSHEWPGNVRELRNVVERLLLFPEKPESAIRPEGSGPEESHLDLMKLPFHDARARWNERFEKFYLSAILDANGGVVTRAAQAAGIPRQTFHRLMSKHGLSK